MIGAVVMAAGTSRRMGQPKLNLAWGDTTVLGQIVRVLTRTMVEEILVVYGAVQPVPQPGWELLSLRIVNNPGAAQGEMLETLQLGLQLVSPQVDAVLVMLGDQPQIEVGVVTALCQAYETRHSPFVIPSYRQRRGHPWLVCREQFVNILALRPPDTLREFLKAHEGLIEYIPVDTESVLQDLDTPQDYERFHP